MSTGAEITNGPPGPTEKTESLSWRTTEDSDDEAVEDMEHTDSRTDDSSDESMDPNDDPTDWPTHDMSDNSVSIKECTDFFTTNEIKKRQTSPAYQAKNLGPPKPRRPLRSDHVHALKLWASRIFERAKERWKKMLVCLVLVSVFYIVTSKTIAQYIVAREVECGSTSQSKMFLSEMKLQHPNIVDDIRVFVRQVENAVKRGEKKYRNVISTIFHSNKFEDAQKVANKLADFSLKYFCKTNEIYHLKGDVIREYPSYFNLTNIKEEITGKGVMVLYNFEVIPVDIIKLFHAICDKYDPFIDTKAVIILLFNTNKDYSLLTMPETKEKLFDAMRDLWPELTDAHFNSLATRLTENFINI